MLMMFREIIGICCENDKKHTFSWGEWGGKMHSFLISEHLVQILITELKPGNF
jgi:hypothetical protein